jgi:two-component system, NarL family, sensor histidine kinase DesK
LSSKREGRKAMKDIQVHDPQVHEQSERGGFLKTQDRSLYLLWLVWIVWMPFLVPPIVGLFQVHTPLPPLVVTLAGIAVFAGIYMWATWQNVQERFGMLPGPHMTIVKEFPILLLVVLCVVLALLGDVNGNTLLEPFIYTSAYIAGRLTVVRAGVALLVLALLSIVVGLLTHLTRFEIGQGVVYVLVVGAVTMSMVRFSMTSRELRFAREEIAHLAVTNERLRIARDLHDLLGHNLSLIALKSELARRLIAVAPERAATEIGDIETVARTTLQEVREAVASYRQPTLASELQGAQEILSAAGIVYRYEGDAQLIATLPTAIEAALSWVVREAVTNVIRHSRARHCTIRVKRSAGEVCVEVVDDGTGIQPVAASTGALSSGGNGLRGLSERISTLGGSCEVGPRKEGSFRLAVVVPLAQSSHDARTVQAPSLPAGCDDNYGDGERSQ